jgi:hypothetical protein
MSLDLPPIAPIAAAGIRARRRAVLRDVRDRADRFLRTDREDAAARLGAA